MLAQRRRRLANIEPTLGECLVFTGICPHSRATRMPYIHEIYGIVCLHQLQ